MQLVSYFFFLNTDDAQCNARMTSETLLINCSSRVHISFTVYFGLAFASIVCALRLLTVQHALTVQMGKLNVSGTVL